MAKKKNKVVVSKKQDVKSKKKGPEVSGWNLKSVLKILSNSLAGIKRLLTLTWQNATRFIKGIPSWVRSRPEAIRKWYIEDKKKKKYRSFRLQKRIKDTQKPVPSVKKLLSGSLTWLWQNKKIVVGIFAVQCIIYVILIRAPGSMDIETIQESVQDLFGGTNSLSANFATLGAVIGASDGSQSNTAAISIMTICMSLVYIWAIRQLYADKKINVRDAYYNALTPIIPVAIILLVISLQLIPFAAASFVYATARSGGLFASGFEDLIVFVITALIALLTLYWITSAVIAAYIATLPGMYPLHALRAAKKLVQFRRFTVFKRILALPVIIGVLYLGLLLIFIRLVPSAALIVAEAFPFVILPFIHIYIYKLYRALL